MTDNQYTLPQRERKTSGMFSKDTQARGSHRPLPSTHVPSTLSSKQESLLARGEERGAEKSELGRHDAGYILIYLDRARR